MFVTTGKKGTAKGTILKVLGTKRDYLGQLVTISGSDVRYSKFMGRTEDANTVQELIDRGFFIIYRRPKSKKFKEYVWRTTK